MLSSLHSLFVYGHLAILAWVARCPIVHTESFSQAIHLGASLFELSKLSDRWPPTPAWSLW